MTLRVAVVFPPTLAVLVPIAVAVVGIPTTFPAALVLVNPVIVRPIVAVPPSRETTGSKSHEKNHSQRSNCRRA
jgi:hypothetical protein